MDLVALLFAPVHPDVLLRLFYLGASALILVIQVAPSLKTRFLAYGPRVTTLSSEPSVTGRRSPPIPQFLDHLASIRVPHRYFTHFYVVSVLSSLYWGWHMWKGTSIFTKHVWYPFFDDRKQSMTLEQVYLVWFLMLLQGVRRLVESYTYTSTSKSGMWFGHWILGLAFYIAINIAVWIEGTPAFKGTKWMSLGYSQWKLVVITPAVLTCHWLQHEYHAYLYRLRTEHSGYQLPSHPLFRNLLCPHYTCEVMIYLLLSLLAAPVGRYCNWTLASATVFVAVNLGVTASGTKDWYEQRFGAEKVKRRRRMIPWVW